jgi:single-strand DNA-binding protein
VGQDPKISQGATGKRTATFSVATSEKWKSADGTQKESTEWHNIFVLAEHSANFVASYVSKGDCVVVEGQLQTKEFTDREGGTRKATSIVVKPVNGNVGLLKTNNPTPNEIAPMGAASSDLEPEDIPF